MRAARGLKQLTVEVIDGDVVLCLNLPAESAGEGVAEIDTQVAVVDIGLRRLLRVGSGEHEHVLHTLQGLAPTTAVAGLDGKHHSAIQALAAVLFSEDVEGDVATHLLHDVAYALCAEILLGVLVAPQRSLAITAVSAPEEEHVARTRRVDDMRQTVGAAARHDVSQVLGA